MDPINKTAFDAAKEIAISCLSGTTLRIDKENGEAVADFFEAIYNRALKIAKEAEVK